jgi:glutathione S-transferase
MADTACPAAAGATPMGAMHYRWLFFAAGPMEAAITDQYLGLQVALEKQGFLG